MAKRPTRYTQGSINFGKGITGADRKASIFDDGAVVLTTNLNSGAVNIRLEADEVFQLAAVLTGLEVKT